MNVQLERRKLLAVAEKFAYQTALGFYGLALFHDQHGHKAVGNQKQHGQDGHPALLLTRSGFNDWQFSGFNSPN